MSCTRITVLIAAGLLGACGGSAGSSSTNTSSPSAAQLVFEGPGLPGGGNIQELYTVNLDGSNLKQLTPDGLSRFLAHFSPDGTRLVYTKFLLAGYGEPNAQADVAVYDFGSLAETQLTQTGMAYQPVWSPDGQRLAYFLSHGSTFGENPTLWIMNADGTQAQEIAAPSGALDDEFWGDLAWSSDDWILFSVAQNPDNCFKVRLDKIRPDGTARTQVTDGGPNCTPAGMQQYGDADPGFSPDGQTIYSSRGIGPLPGMPSITLRHLYAFSSDAWTPGKIETDLSATAEPNCVVGVPKASPDGTQILVSLGCLPAPQNSMVTVTDTRGSVWRSVVGGFGGDWNPVATYR